VTFLTQHFFGYQSCFRVKQSLVRTSVCNVLVFHRTCGRTSVYIGLYSEQYIGLCSEQYTLKAWVCPPLHPPLCPPSYTLNASFCPPLLIRTESICPPLSSYTAHCTVQCRAHCTVQCTRMGGQNDSFGVYEDGVDRTMLKVSVCMRRGRTERCFQCV
jgi:hypothetical protein